MKRFCLLLAVLLLLCGCKKQEQGQPLSELVTPPRSESNIQIVEADDLETVPVIEEERAPVEEIPEEPDIVLPEVDLSSWELVLVNAGNSIDTYAPPDRRC